MNSSRRKIAAILEALGVPPSARRSVPTPAHPACESLEGRQLLAGDMGLGGLALTGLALGTVDVSAVGGGGGGAMPGPGAMAPGSGSAAGTQLQTDLVKLQTDTQAIADQSLVTPALTTKVTADLNAVKAAETSAPNPAWVTNLQNITKAVDSSPGGPTLSQAFELEIYQNVVFLSEGVAPSLLNQLNADEMAVMNATGITAAQEATLAADHAAISADQTAMKPVAGSTTSGSPMTPTSTPALAATTGSSVMNGMGELASAGASVVVGSPSGGSGMSVVGDTGPLGLGLLPAVPTTSAAQATVVADQSQLKTDRLTLSNELKTIDATSNVTPAMQAVVRADLAAVKGAASAAPNAASVATLKSDLTTAMTNSGGPTANQIAQVQADEAAVYTSEGVNTLLIQKLQSAQEAIIAASNITPAEEGALYADTQAIQADQTKLETDLQALPATTTTTTTTAAGTTTTATPGGFGMAHRGFRGPAGFLPGA